MKLTKKLNHKLNSTKMLLTGATGLVINEIAGIFQNEPATTYELSQLPKGYLIKGYGHLIGNDKLINQGRNYIKEYRLKQKTKQGIFTN